MMKRNVPHQADAPKNCQRPNLFCKCNHEQTNVNEDNSYWRHGTPNSQHEKLPLEVWLTVCKCLSLQDMARMQQVHKFFVCVLNKTAEGIAFTQKPSETVLEKIAFVQKRQCWPQPQTLSAARYCGLRIKRSGALQPFGEYSAWSCSVPESFCVVSVVKTNTHAMALDAQGTVFCWGNGLYGCQFLRFDVLVTPRPLLSLPPVSYIAANDCFSAVLTKSGYVYTWGFGQYGQNGHGNLETYEQPRCVEALENVKHIAVADYHCAAVVGEKGYVFVWGSNQDQNCGPTTTLLQTTPKQVPGLYGAASVTAALHYTAAVQHTGTTIMWGGNMLWPQRHIISLQFVYNECVLQAEAATTFLVLRTEKGNVFYVLFSANTSSICKIRVQAANMNKRIVAMSLANNNNVVVEQANGKLVGIGWHAQNWF